MVELKIIKIDKYNEYILQDENNTYSLALEFYYLPKPQIGDVLIAPEDILNTGSPDFVHSLYFEPLAKDDKIVREQDIFGLHTKEKNYILKRVYG